MKGKCEIDDMISLCVNVNSDTSNFKALFLLSELVKVVNKQKRVFA